MSDDKTAAERAAEAFYPSSEHPEHPGVERERLILREAFRSGAAWAADRRVAPDRETLAWGLWLAHEGYFTVQDIAGMSNWFLTTDPAFDHPDDNRDEWLSLADALLASGLLIPAEQTVKDGVCLSCGGAVLASGEHIDPKRHAADQRTADRETIALALFGELAKLPTFDVINTKNLADAVLAVLVPADLIRAEAQDEVIDWIDAECMQAHNVIALRQVIVEQARRLFGKAAGA